MSENKINRKDKMQIAGFVRFTPLRPRAKKKLTKIKMKSITFDYGECDGIDPYPLAFSTWREANGWIFAMSPGDVVYYKTWFTIEYENGRKYNGRYEIQGKLSDRLEIADLGAHIKKELTIGSGRHPSIPSYLTKSEQEICKDFLDNYEIKSFEKYHHEVQNS